MACPKCSAEVAATEWQPPTRGEMAKGTLMDWRTWAIAVIIMSVTGLVLGMLNVRSGAGAGGGAAVGMIIAIRMTKLRKCPKCAAVVTPPS